MVCNINVLYILCLLQSGPAAHFASTRTSHAVGTPYSITVRTTTVVVVVLCARKR